VSLTLNLGTSPQNVYFIFTNESTSASSAGMPTVASSLPPVKALAPSRQALPPTPGVQVRNSGPPPAILAANRRIANAWASRSPAGSRSAVLPVVADSAPTTGYTIGSTTSTYIPPASAASSYPSGFDFTCTLRAVVDASGTNVKRKLFIWVDNNCWDTSYPNNGKQYGYTYVSSDPYPYKVNTAMVNAVATAFLHGYLDGASTATGTIGSGDIYDLDTAIFGKEYFDAGATLNSTQTSAGLITPQGEIHIYILPLNPGTTQGNGGYLGYFYAADDYQKSTVLSDSNQKIMFQLDAEMLANPTNDGNTPATTNIPSTGWTLKNSLATPTASYWPNQILSTLAHEFQHMIQFYQKQVTSNVGATDTWINEMCSMVTEDLVASQLGTEGSRGVPWNSGTYDYTAGNISNNDLGARMAFFDEYYPTVGLESSWGTSVAGSLANYGVAYSFGAWLARNYGGPALFSKIVDSPYINDQAVTNAVNTLNSTNLTMPQLVEQWAATMVMGSYATTTPYQLIGPSTTTPGEFGPTNSIGTNTGVQKASYTYGSLDASQYYPLSYTAKTGSASQGSNPGPQVFSTMSGVPSISPLCFYYYTPAVTTSGSAQPLTGSQTYTLTLPPNVECQVVTVP
jgi:hypothetical protein